MACFDPAIASIRRCRAFSLLELILVLGIVATISAVAVPRYLRSADRYRTEAAARRIIADLALRSDALQTSEARTVRFSPVTDDYVLDGVADFDHGTIPYTVELDAAPYATQIVTAVFDEPVVEDATDEVVFDVYGRPDSDGSVVVTSGASTHTIVLDQETGKASIQ